MPALALRGAITIDNDLPEEVHGATTRLLNTLFERNSLSHEDVISVMFSATKDVRSAPPAVAARDFGLVDVPLLCTQEMDVDGSLGSCIRLLMHVETELPRKDLHHVYLRGAIVLRPELARPGDDR